MTREQIEKAARDYFESDVIIGVDSLVSFGIQIRDAALEEAAKLAEAVQGSKEFSQFGRGSGIITAAYLTKTIRALKAKP